MNRHKPLDYYIEQFHQNVLKSHDIDYANRGSVQRANRAVDRYRLAAKRIAEYVTVGFVDGDLEVIFSK